MAYDRTKPLRIKIFYPSATFAMSLYVANAWYGWRDECLVAYELIILSGFLCLFMASYWRLLVERVSDVVRWLIVMIAGLEYSTALQHRARMLALAGEREEYQQFLGSWLWHTRTIPLLIALIYMGALIISRVIHREDGR